MNYYFHPAAEAEFLELVGYYESKVIGLGRNLIDELEDLVSRIIDSPSAWQIAAEPNIRKAPLDKFPLSIIYRYQENNLQILALAHDKRRPAYWLLRS